MSSVLSEQEIRLEVDTSKKDHGVPDVHRAAGLGTVGSQLRSRGSGPGRKLADGR